MVKGRQSLGWRFAELSPNPKGPRFCLCTRPRGADWGPAYPRGIQSNSVKRQAAWKLQAPGDHWIPPNDSTHSTSESFGSHSLESQMSLEMALSWAPWSHGAGRGGSRLISLPFATLSSSHNGWRTQHFPQESASYTQHLKAVRSTQGPSPCHSPDTAAHPMPFLLMSHTTLSTSLQCSPSNPDVIFTGAFASFSLTLAPLSTAPPHTRLPGWVSWSVVFITSNYFLV